MLTKTIGQLDEVTSIGVNDYLEIENSGISKKISYGSIQNMLIEPLSANINADTVSTVATGIGRCLIRITQDYLIASSTTTVYLTIETGIASTESIIIPITANTDTITSGNLLIDAFVDSAGNIASGSFSITGTNANGRHTRIKDGSMEQMIDYTTGAAGNITVTFPTSFSSIDYNVQVTPFLSSNPTVGHMAQAFNYDTRDGSSIQIRREDDGGTVSDTGVSIRLNGRWL